jgi:hypothetical protein
MKNKPLTYNEYKQQNKDYAELTIKLFSMFLKEGEGILFNCPVNKQKVLMVKQNNQIGLVREDQLINAEKYPLETIIPIDDNHQTDNFKTHYLSEALNHLIPVGSGIMVDMTDDRFQLNLTEKAYVFMKKTDQRKIISTKVRLNKEDNAVKFVGKLLPNIELDDIMNK